jgi:hypothetical protein
MQQSASTRNKPLIFHLILATGNVQWGVKLDCPQQLLSFHPPKKAHVSSSTPMPRKSIDMQNECSNRRKFWGKLIAMMTNKKFTAKITVI